jgi:hypothetical protein
MFQIQTLIHKGNRDVGCNRDPNLRLHCSSRVAIKGFDTKVLLDPLFHHVKRACLEIALLAEDVEYFSTVHFSIADLNQAWIRSLQIYQSMKYVKGRGHPRHQLRVRRFVGVKRTRRYDQGMGQVHKNFQRSDSVCVGQGIVRNRFAAQPHEIKMFALRSTSCNHSTKCFEWQIGHNSRDYQLSSVHGYPSQIISANDDSSWKSDSNRGHQK